MIKVENLVKIYKVPIKSYKKNIKNIFIIPSEEKVGVNGISFTINTGEIVGFIGFNGAGKTTTIKMLSGILTPSNGKIEVLGYVPNKDRRKYTKEISVLMGQKSILFYDIPVIESLKFYKDVYEIPDNDFKTRLNVLTEKLELKDLLHVPVRKLSLGQRMRCEIVASVLHNPKVIFLDEPTLGLDIISKQKILEFFEYLNETFNTTIFFTTHDINDIDKFCKRIIIIDKGEIKYDGKTDEIFERNKFKILELNHNDNFKIESLENQEFKLIDKSSLKTRIKIQKDKMESIVKAILENEFVEDFNVNKVSLEEILYELYDNKDNREDD